MNILRRYHRQEILSFIGKNGQEKIAKATVCVVGVGALGTVVSELLCRAGVGTLMLIDRDVVDLTNLQRQALCTEKDVGLPKPFAAATHLQDINSSVKILQRMLDLDNSWIKEVSSLKTDVVVDCTDNLSTRLLLNDYCVKEKIPLVSGAAIGTTGWVFVVKNGACLRCFLDQKVATGTCDTLGVLNTITHLIGTMQANETIKCLIGKEYEQTLFHIDLFRNHFEKVVVPINKKCKTHTKEYPALKNARVFHTKLCGSHQYQFFTRQSFSSLKNILKEKIVRVSEQFFQIENITVFKGGRVLVSAKDEKQAKLLFTQYLGDE